MIEDLLVRHGFGKVRGVVLWVYWKWQRATRGYADCDVWNLNTYLLTWLPSAIRQLRDTGNSYPGEGHEYGKTAEDWDDTLTCLAELLELRLHQYNNALPVSDAGLELLVKVFDSLWD